ncbi:MAG: SDR family NAD(P)-dependent oxidoreductase [Saprospiraceae bacterium]
MLSITLITGGSHGIGLALARECLRRGHTVAIAALPDRHLDAALQELTAQAEPARVIPLPIDFSEPDSVEEIRAELVRRKLRVRYLINNVGFGRGGLFEHTPLAEYQAMLRLNNGVLVDMCYAFLDDLKAERGGMLNLSSMEATMPLPYKTVYTGTKAFVYAFSLALAEELRPGGVSVTVLCPGPVLTNEDGLKRVKAQGGRAKLLLFMPDDIAPGAIKGMIDRRAVIIPGALPLFLVRLASVVPRRYRMRILEKLFRKYRDEPARGEKDAVEPRTLV